MAGLRDQRQEKFCLNSASGMSDVQAYRKAYKCTLKTALSNAWRVRELEGVKKRIAAIRLKSQTETTMDMRERREWMARIKRVNVVTFDPETDGDLVEEIVIQADGSKRIKLSSKRACIMDDARLAGDLVDRQDLTTNGEPMPSAVPVIALNMPQSFLARRGSQTQN